MLSSIHLLHLSSVYGSISDQRNYLGGISVLGTFVKRPPGYGYNSDQRNYLGVIPILVSLVKRSPVYGSISDKRN